MNNTASRNLDEVATGISAEQAAAVISAENAGVADTISESALGEGRHPLVAARRRQVANDIQAVLRGILNTGADVDDGKKEKAA